MSAGVPTLLETAFASPRTVRIGSRDLVFRPFRLSDFGELKTWINQQLPHPVKVAREVAEMFNVSKEERTELMRMAYDDLKKGEYAITDPKCMEVMDSPLGAAYMLWLGARRDTPGLTLDDTTDMLNHLTIAQVQDIISYIQGVDPADPTLPPTPTA